MEIISYEYPRTRREFGIHPSFSDSQPAVESIGPNDEWSKQWLTSAETTVELDCIPELAQHEVNTERFVQTARGTNHTDGAWPAEIKTSEFVDRQRYLRRITNETSYQQAVCSLVTTASMAIAQNNTIDLYQDYFQGERYDHGTTAQPHAAKTVCVFRDPNKLKRAATKISWHPDGANKLAVSYAIMSFQGMTPDTPILSYIWDVNNPNTPDAKIIPGQAPLTCLVYNPRSPDHLVGGAYSGVVGFWDLRKGSTAVETSSLDHSHHDPVYDVYWVQSRTGNECCSVSTDGQLLWWDIRKLKKGPTDAMLLNGENEVLFGGTSMEYKSDAGATRYLVGTEQGVVLMCDRKAKKDADSQKSIKSTYGLHGGNHHGPIYSVQRNPFNFKYFMTVGDWSAKIWMEDLKAPILTTRYDHSYLTSGCWSPTRPGVFFTTKVDGTLDIWDLYHKQNDPTFSTKVGEGSLTSIKVQNQGRLVALGSVDGTTTVLQLSRGLAEPLKDEKSSLAAIFERETKREKNLELRYIQRRRDLKEKKRLAEEAEKKATLQPSNPSTASNIPSLDDPESRTLLKKIEDDFYAIIDLANNKDTNNTTQPTIIPTGGGEDEDVEREEKFTESKEQDPPIRTTSHPSSASHMNRKPAV